MNTQNSIGQTHISEIFTLTGTEKDTSQLMLSLGVLSEVDYVRDSVSFLTGDKRRAGLKNDIQDYEKGDRDDFNRVKKEAREYAEICDSIYIYFLNNLEIVLESEGAKSVLIQIPSTHSNFLYELIKRKGDTNSYLANVDVKYYIFDSESISQLGEKKEEMNNIYQSLYGEIRKVDKFVEIKDTTLPYKDFTQSEKGKKNISAQENDFVREMKEIGKLKTPRLKTYFPTYQQAQDDGGNNSLEFARKLRNAFSLDSAKIKKANEELVGLFDENDKIVIKGGDADIEFDITGKKARNSWGDTNQPGSEVFSTPNKYGVNGWVRFPNLNIVKMFGREEERLIKGIKLFFQNGSLEEIDIDSDEYNDEQKKNIISKLTTLIFKKEENRYLGEIAFGTTPQVESGSILHPLVAEKAIGMHIALGNSYKYEEMFNGNEGADFHWDIIGGMKNSEVFFEKGGKRVLVMKDGIYNEQVVPLLSEYQKTVEEKRKN